MTYRIHLVLLTTLALAACDTPVPVDNSTRAQQIAMTSIIVDTHIDVPFRLENKMEDISVATDGGDFDYPRAVRGGLNAPFMSIYTYGFADTWPDKFAIATSTADVRRQFEAGLISLPMGMENGSPLEGDLNNLQRFYDRGIRYITLAHSLSNHISDSSYDKNRQWNGLSAFGVEVVREMNRLGIMIDISHVSDEAFWQTIETSEVPVIASHSSARKFTPGFERNMSDEMIVALASNGGVIQINFGSSFLTAEALAYSQERTVARKQWLENNPQLDEVDSYRQFPAIYAEENGPLPYATLDDVLDHFDHVVAIAGVDHVGIGSDYDGVGDSLPVGLKDVASYPNLIRGLLERGYSEEDIRKILGENLLRVWQVVEDYAATTSSST